MRFRAEELTGQRPTESDPVADFLWSQTVKVKQIPAQNVSMETRKRVMIVLQL